MDKSEKSNFIIPNYTPPAITYTEGIINLSQAVAKPQIANASLQQQAELAQQLRTNIKKELNSEFYQELQQLGSEIVQARDDVILTDGDI